DSSRVRLRSATCSAMDTRYAVPVPRRSGPGGERGQPRGLGAEVERPRPVEEVAAAGEPPLAGAVAERLVEGAPRGREDRADAVVVEVEEPEVPERAERARHGPGRAHRGPVAQKERLELGTPGPAASVAERPPELG